MSSRSLSQSPGLRGKRLEERAIEELRDANLWLTGSVLTWNALARRLQVSREAIAKKPVVVEAYLSVSSVVDGEESRLFDGNRTRAGAMFTQTGLDEAMGS